GAQREEVPAQVHVEDLAELAGVGVRQRADVGDPGVGDQDVHTAERPAGVIETGGYGVFVGHVQPEGGARGPSGYRGDVARRACSGTAAAMAASWRVLPAQTIPTPGIRNTRGSGSSLLRVTPLARTWSAK